MKFSKTPLSGAMLIDLDRSGDERGFFARVFCAREFAERGLCTNLVQISTSLSVPRHTLRGMHYQLPPYAETKLVRCLAGALFDVIVDLRPASNTYGQSYGAELSAANRTMMYVPKGFAHGFLTLTENTEILYFMDEYYGPESGRGLRWDDPGLGIAWPAPPALVSERDASYPDFDREAHRELLVSLCGISNHGSD
jgi:dTDP-4-dehydrorhamnose 3,5-epimerase